MRHPPLPSLVVILIEILNLAYSRSPLINLPHIVDSNSTWGSLCLAFFIPYDDTSKLSSKIALHLPERSSGEDKLCPTSTFEYSHLTFVKVKWVYNEAAFCTCGAEQNDKYLGTIKLEPFLILELVLDRFNQIEIFNTFKDKTGKRDHHNQNMPHSQATFFQQAKILADTINSSLITRQFATQLNLDVDKVPKVRFNLFLYLLHPFNPSEESLWEEHFKGTGGQLSISRMRFSLPINFGYCATPKMRLMKPWNLQILLVGFNGTMWVALLATFVILGLTFYISVTTASLQNIALSLISCLITLSATITRETRRSKLFILWLFMCCIIVNYYTGENASFIIKPAEEEAMETVSEAAEANYSLIFKSWSFFRLLRIWQEAESRSSQPDIRAAGDLLDKWETSNTGMIQGIMEYVEAFAFREKAMIVTFWYYLIADIQYANWMIQVKGKGIDRHCYIGKRLLPGIETYRVFMPPGNQKLFRVQQALDASGITDYWDEENLGRIYSFRNQDRVKIISPTKVVYDFQKDKSSLKLEGKVTSIFFLWGVCASFCLIVGMLEWIYCHCRHRQLLTGVIVINVGHA